LDSLRAVPGAWWDSGPCLEERRESHQEVEAAEAVLVGGVLPLEDLGPLLHAGPAHKSTHDAGKGGSMRPMAVTRPLEPCSDREHGAIVVIL
jgi:hypothetical protein